jgi:hypothetical protein
MAFGDHRRVNNAIDYQGGLTQNRIDNLRTDIMRQNQNFENDVSYGRDRAISDYDSIMGDYRSLLNRGPQNTNFGAYSGYQNFADSGGYSAQDIQDLRARAIDPIRGVYSRAQSELDRNRSLQGGYSPNYAAASSKMTRDLAHAIGDANVNVNASLADQIRQGKLAGLGGMTDIDKARSSEGLANRGMDLSTVNSMQGMYGATPGLYNSTTNALNQSNNQRQGVEQMQSSLAESIIRGLLGMSQVPGNFQSAMGNVSSALGVAGQVGGALGGYGGFGSPLPSRTTTPNWGGMPSGGGGISY